MMKAMEEPSAANDALVAKVRKLLAMAEQSPNAHEGDSFSRKAAELIAEHRIDPRRLQERSGDDLDVRTWSIGRGAYVRARLALLQAIAEAYGCSVVFQAGRDGTTAYVAGYRTDLETTDVLYHSLHAQATARLTSERRSTGAATQRWRRSFLFGYAAQVAAMLEKSHRKAVRNTHPSNAAVPALRARERQVADFARKEFGRVRAARRATPASSTGWVAGQRAAASADIGRTRVASRKAIGRGA